MVFLATLIGASAVISDQVLFHVDFNGDSNDTINPTNLTDTEAGGYDTGILGQCRLLTIDDGWLWYEQADLNGVNTHNYTFNIWISVNSTGSEANNRIITGLKDAGGEGSTFDRVSGNTYHMDGYDNPSPNVVLNDSTWYMVTGVRAGLEERLYRDGVLINFTSSAVLSDAGDNGIGIGALYNNAQETLGCIDEITYWNRSLDQSEITDLYAGGSGLAYPFVSGVTPTISLSFTDPVTEVTNTSHSLVFTDYNVSGNTTATLYYNGTAYGGTTTYYNDSYLSVDTTVITPFVYLNATDVQNFYWEYTIEYVNGSSESPANTSTDNQTIIWDLATYPRVNVTVYDVQNSAYLSNFTVNDSLSLSTTSGEVYFYKSSAGTYLLTADAGASYELQDQNVTFTAGTFGNYTFYLQPYNSLQITIFNENTGVQVTENVSITFMSNLTQWTNVSQNGTFFIKDLYPTEYQLLFTSANYSNRTYTVTVGNRSFQNLNVYLASGTSTTTFTVKDIDTAIVLEDVSVTMYRMINGTWATVSSGSTDITGTIQFQYVPGAYYRFFMSKSEYQDYTFYLNPILFSTYDIRMTKDVTINYTQDYDKLSILYSPTSFQDGNTTTFNFIIASPEGTLISYGFNLTYPGGFNSSSGVNSIGEQLTISATLVNSSSWDVVTLNYYYTDTLSGLRTFTITMPIWDIGSGNMTFYDNKVNDFGLGVFERMLIITIAVIFIVGIATLVGQPIPGLALGLLALGYFVYLGFIPIWSVLITMFIGVMFLIWKSGGY